MKLDVNRVLKIYLGADENGGYEPLRRDERMKEAFPESYPQMMAVIAPYLAEDPDPDWTSGDLIQQAKGLEAVLRRKFPELDAIAVKALANRWHFGASR
jgi:hypothetical protein